MNELKYKDCVGTTTNGERVVNYTDSQTLSKADKEMLIANSMKAVRDGDSKQTVLKNKEICIGYMNRIIKHYQKSSEIVGNQEDIELEEQGYNLSPDTYKDPWEKF